MMPGICKFGGTHEADPRVRARAIARGWPPLAEDQELEFDYVHVDDAYGDETLLFESLDAQRVPPIDGRRPEFVFVDFEYGVGVLGRLDELRAGEADVRDGIPATPSFNLHNSKISGELGPTMRCAFATALFPKWLFVADVNRAKNQTNVTASRIRTFGREVLGGETGAAFPFVFRGFRPDAELGWMRASR